MIVHFVIAIEIVFFFVFIEPVNQEKRAEVINASLVSFLFVTWAEVWTLTTLEL
jgi:hypothetical protein